MLLKVSLAAAMRVSVLVRSVVLAKVSDEPRGAISFHSMPGALNLAHSSSSVSSVVHSASPYVIESYVVVCPRQSCESSSAKFQHPGSRFCMWLLLPYRSGLGELVAPF